MVRVSIYQFSSKTVHYKFLLLLSRSHKFASYPSVFVVVLGVWISLSALSLIGGDDVRTGDFCLLLDDKLGGDVAV